MSACHDNCQNWQPEWATDFFNRNSFFLSKEKRPLTPCSGQHFVPPYNETNRHEIQQLL